MSDPGAPLKDQLFIAAPDIDTWSSSPVDAKVPNARNSRSTLELAGTDNRESIFVDAMKI